MRSRNLRVVVLDNGVNIASRIPEALKDAELSFIDDITQIFNDLEYDIFISGFILSHAENEYQYFKHVQDVTNRFPVAIFFEPSSFNKIYLESEGFRSYHSGFDTNKCMDIVGMEFIALSATSSKPFKIEHYADNIAFDSFKSWIVPVDFPNNTFPSGRATDDYKIFDEPVFEYSWFVCHGFAAANFTLEHDLTLVEVKSLRFRAQSAKIDLAVSLPSTECGKLVYSTSKNLEERFKNLQVPEVSSSFGSTAYSNPAHQAAVSNWQALFKPERAETTVAELSNCIISGSGAVVANGVFVSETEYLLPYLSSSILDAVSQGLQRRHPREHIDGITILGLNFISENYYHWVAQALLSVSLCAEIYHRLNPGGTIRVVTGRNSPFQRQFLEILFKEYPKTEIIELQKDEFVSCETILYCNSLGPLFPMSQIVLEMIPFAEKLIKNAGLSAPSAHRLIYVARTDTKARIILNEEALIEALEKLGFEILVASNTPVAEQIEVFQNAKLIIGPHGAGLTNIVFSRPGTILLELIQSTYLNHCLMRLAQTAGVQYFYEMFFPPDDEPIGESWFDNVDRTWYIDIDRVINAINGILEQPLAPLLRYN